MTRIVTTEEKLRAIVKEAVHDELRAFGLRTDTPEAVDAMAENLRFLAWLRRVWDASAATIGRAVLVAIVTLIIGAVALGMKLHLISDVKLPGR